MSPTANGTNSGGAVIVDVRGMEILDSRGNPTAEAEVVLSDGARARAAAPSGASTGKREARELRDGGGRYHGRGVLKAVANICALGDALKGMPANNQRGIDDAIKLQDGAKDKSNLGGNASISVSMACAKAAAESRGVPLYRHLAELSVGSTPPAHSRMEVVKPLRLPVPMLNVINGGAHANNTLDIQEFMITPRGFDDFATALRASVETYHALGAILREKGMPTATGDEGGFAPPLPDSETALSLLVMAIERAGYRAGEQIALALDCAASELRKGGAYHLPNENFTGDAEAFVALLAKWVKKYPIVSIEDACAEDDWHGWQHLTRELGGDIQLVGDDLFVTDEALLKRGVECGAANAILIKPNQIGTLTEALDATRAAQVAGYKAVVSHRSGETEHSDIADIAVGTNAGQIKTGAPARGERTAKYNRLLRIAGELGGDAVFN